DWVALYLLLSSSVSRNLLVNLSQLNLYFGAAVVLEQLSSCLWVSGVLSQHQNLNTYEWSAWLARTAYHWDSGQTNVDALSQVVSNYPWAVHNNRGLAIQEQGVSLVVCQLLWQYFAEALYQVSSSQTSLAVNLGGAFWGNQSYASALPPWSSSIDIRLSVVNEQVLTVGVVFLRACDQLIGCLWQLIFADQSLVVDESNRFHRFWNTINLIVVDNSIACYWGEVLSQVSLVDTILVKWLDNLHQSTVANAVVNPRDNVWALTRWNSQLSLVSNILNQQQLNLYIVCCCIISKNLLDSVVVLA